MTSEDLPTLADLSAQIQRWSDAGLRALESTTMWLPMNTRAVTAAYTMVGNDKVILADATGGAFSVTLPSAVGRINQQPLTVKRMNGGGNAVTIASGGGTIDGSATDSLASQYAVKTYVSDNANWWRIV